MTGDTPDTVAVALAGGLIITPTALAHLSVHPAAQGQLLTLACLKGHRLPAGVLPLAPAGVFSANN